MKQTFITLNNGCQIPQFGLGVFQIEGDKDTKKVCLEALNMGYRHIDTAHAYQNERGVGEAVGECGIDRKAIWITSKLWPSEYGEGVTSAAIDKMLSRLSTDYIDLLLLHQPLGDYMGAWKDMEKAVASGKVRSIGLSNFEADRLEDVLTAAQIKPAVLQVECHPYFQQTELRSRIKPYGTVLECWYPLGHGNSGLANEPVFTSLARKYGKSSIQIILRWHIQMGNIIFPKSTNPNHLRDNINIFDFSLTDSEMQEIAKLNRNKRFFTMSLADLKSFVGSFIPND